MNGQVQATDINWMENSSSSSHRNPITRTHWCLRSLYSPRTKLQRESSTRALGRSVAVTAIRHEHRTELGHGFLFFLASSSIFLMLWFLTNVTALPMKQFHRWTFVATGTAPLPRCTGATTVAHVAGLPRVISALTNSAAVYVVSSCSFSIVPLNLYRCRCVGTRAPPPANPRLRGQTCPCTPQP